MRREGRDVKRRKVKMGERMTKKRKMIREEVVTVTTEERDAGVALETGEEVGAETGEIEIDTGGTGAETSIVIEETGNF